MASISLLFIESYIICDMYMRVLPGLPPAAGISVYTSKEKNTFIFLFSTNKTHVFQYKKGIRNIYVGVV